MKTALLTLLAFYFFPYFARADTCPSILDTAGLTVISKSRIEVRISDEKVAYLGLDIEYQNPDVPEEFVRVVSRHVPVIFAKPKQRNENLLREVAEELNVRKEEQDLLNELEQNTDPVVYVKWRIKKDSRTGKDVRDGDVSVCFLGSDGEWLFAQNEQIAVQFLSELAGRQYHLSTASHILTVDPGDIIQAMGKKQ